MHRLEVHDAIVEHVAHRPRVALEALVGGAGAGQNIAPRPLPNATQSYPDPTRMFPKAVDGESRAARRVVFVVDAQQIRIAGADDDGHIAVRIESAALILNTFDEDAVHISARHPGQRVHAAERVARAHANGAKRDTAPNAGMTISPHGQRPGHHVAVLRNVKPVVTVRRGRKRRGKHPVERACVRRCSGNVDIDGGRQRQDDIRAARYGINLPGRADDARDRVRPGGARPRRSIPRDQFADVATTPVMPRANTLQSSPVSGVTFVLGRSAIHAVPSCCTASLAA